MSRVTFGRVAALALILSLSPTVVWAQSGEAGLGTVSGMGMVSVKQKPTRLRMIIQLQGCKKKSEPPIWPV